MRPSSGSIDSLPLPALKRVGEVTSPTQAMLEPLDAERGGHMAVAPVASFLLNVDREYRASHRQIS